MNSLLAELDPKKQKSPNKKNDKAQPKPQAEKSPQASARISDERKEKIQK